MTATELCLHRLKPYTHKKEGSVYPCGHSLTLEVMGDSLAQGSRVRGRVLLLRLLWFWGVRRLRRLDQPPVLCGVVRPTATALQTQDVEGHSAMSLAVIANDLDGSVLVFSRHWGLGYFLVPLLPICLHVASGVHAERAAIGTCFAHLYEASFMK